MRFVGAVEKTLAPDPDDRAEIRNVQAPTWSRCVRDDVYRLRGPRGAGATSS